MKTEGLSQTEHCDAKGIIVGRDWLELGLDEGWKEKRRGRLSEAVRVTKVINA